MRRLDPTRRHVLRGAFASLTLPFLHSALPRNTWAATPTPNRRVLWYFMPNGMLMEAFTPTTEGPGYALSANLLPLADLQDRMTVISGLTNYVPANTSLACNHECGTASALTDAGISYTGEIKAGTSVDQVIANAIGYQTPFPSMQLGTGEQAIACSGNTCVYWSTISWATPTTPLTSLGSPLVLFERMFGAADETISEEEAATRLLLRTSVLDAVDIRSSSLRNRLSSADAARLDEYLTGVRELEQRIHQLANLQCEEPALPPATPGFQHTVDLMTELMVKAFECDMTRVITFMLGPSVAYTDYSFLGVPNAHHTASHHLDDPEMKAELSTIQAWGLDRMGDIARALAAVSESDGGSLLDHTMLMLVTDLEDPNLHLFDNMPMLVMGGEAGGISHGQHRKLPTQAHSNLWLTAMEFMGLHDIPFGTYATEPIDLS